MVIAGLVSQEVFDSFQALEDLADDLIEFSNAPGTQSNIRCKERRYLRYCNYFNFEPFPLDEGRLIKYVGYLSLSMQTIDSVKMYCGTVCDLSKIRGYGAVHRGRRYYKTILGLRKKMIHEIKQAKPITISQLKAISHLVNINDQKQLAIWVAMLFGFFMFLRKSNLVPTARVHDPWHQLSRRDIKLQGDLILVLIKWSKTNQFGEKMQYPIYARKTPEICPVHLLKVMISRIPAGATHNLFSHWCQGQIVPITYGKLQEQMREWFQLVGVEDPECYSSHLLRCGGSNHAFKTKIPDRTIKILGNWASDCYKRYIDLTIETCVEAWLSFSNS